MFITAKERIGTCYLEFQYCKNNNPIKHKKININAIEHWKEDSLLITDDNFYKLYSGVFDCALLGNGEIGFDFCGVNYYSKESTEKILQKLKATDNKNEVLIIWLEKAIKEANGFYILGI